MGQIFECVAVYFDSSLDCRWRKLFAGSTLDAKPSWSNLLTKQVGEDTWTSAGSEAIALAGSIGIDPQDSNNVYFPFGDHSYFKSTNGGQSMKILTTFKDMKKLYGNRATPARDY